MKRIKKLVSVLVIAAMLVLIPEATSLTTQAAEPKTYSVKYIGGEVDAWRFLPGSTFDDTAYHRELYYLLQELKDGDLVVVHGNTPEGKELDLGNVQLGNLTINQNANAVVFTGGVKECYVLGGSYSAINGNVSIAHLYDTVTCTFNNNVLDMTLHYDGETIYSNISCGGTVGHFSAVSNQTGWKAYELYSVNAAQLIIKDGYPQVHSDHFLPEPTAEYLQAMGAATAPAAPTTPAAPSADASDEYDDVPKTGESNVSFWLLVASALCLLGSLTLRKNNR